MKSLSQKQNIALCSILALITGYALNGILMQREVYADHEGIPIWTPGAKWGKWVGFGHNTNPKVFTELQGTIIFADPNGDLYILPDDNYLNLILPGNYILPYCPKDYGGGIYPQCLKSVWDKYQREILSNYLRLDEEGKLPPRANPERIPVIKSELYGRDQVPELNWSDEDAPPIEILPKDYKVIDQGTVFGKREIIGKHVRIYGLYLQEHQHSMHHDVDKAGGSCLDPFVVKPFDPYLNLMKCYGHAEIHPFSRNYIIEAPLLTVGSMNTETHTVTAPKHTQFYSPTFLKNKIAEVAGRLVHTDGYADVTAQFLIKAPPKPSECDTIHCTLRFKESNVIRFGPYPPHSQSRVTPEGYQVTVSTSGYSVKDPTIFRATWSVWWDTTTPNTIITSAIDGNGKSIDNGMETKSDSMKFDFDATQNPSSISFECNTNLKGWAPCSSPYTANTGNGLKLNALNFFDVRAKTAEGNIDPTPARWQWTIGTPPRDPCNPELRAPNCVVRSVESFTKYESSKLGIRILYPANWQVEETGLVGGALIDIWPPDEDHFDAIVQGSTITIYIIDDADLAIEIKDTIAQAKESGGHGFSDLGKTMLAGYPAYSYDYKDSDRIYKNIFANIEGKIYRFVFVGYERDLENFQKVVDSFEFFDAP